VKTIEQLLADLEMLKTLPQGCYLELGLGSIDLRRFSTHRIVYTQYDGDGIWYFVIQPLIWRKSSDEPWVTSTVKVYSGLEEMNYLVAEMQRLLDQKIAQEHVRYEFNVLRMFNVISDKLVLSALPEFGWRAIITKETV
jgi:hypothetical protein